MKLIMWWHNIWNFYIMWLVLEGEVLFWRLLSGHLTDQVIIVLTHLWYGLLLVHIDFRMWCIIAEFSPPSYFSLYMKALLRTWRLIKVLIYTMILFNSFFNNVSIPTSTLPTCLLPRRLLHHLSVRYFLMVFSWNNMALYDILKMYDLSHISQYVCVV